MEHDLTGKTFGLLTVIELTRVPKGDTTLKGWRCQCKCGKEVNVITTRLVTGHTQSCGCYHRRMLVEAATKANTTHGAWATDEYQTWSDIRHRCTNPKRDNYHRYGGRGIKMCDRWLNSFENFFADMGTRPTADHTIERKDNDGNYEPENCIWSTRKEQANNRSSRWIEHQGERLTMMQWSERTGIPVTTIYNRLKRGWDSERTLTR